MRKYALSDIGHSGRKRKQRVSDKIGAFANLSGRTVEKIAVVCEAARADPERFGDLIELMDEDLRLIALIHHQARPFIASLLPANLFVVPRCLPFDQAITAKSEKSSVCPSVTLPANA